MSHQLKLICSEAEKGLAIALLWERGTTGVIESEQPGGLIELAAFFTTPFPADEFAAWAPRWETIEDTNWVRIVMESWDPIEVGERFFIVPEWRQDATPAGRLRLVVRPGIALGTGYHPTTQMCLEAMERRLRSGDRVFDLGCGSGVLSHAARLLGAGEILACDIDPQATGAAAENLRAAGVDVLLFTGSTRSVPDGVVDLLIANISPATLIEMAPEIRRLLAPGARAILSGFEPERRDEIRAAMAAQDLTSIECDTRGEWACEVVGRRAIQQ